MCGKGDYLQIDEENASFSGTLQECVGFVAGMCVLCGKKTGVNVLWNNDDQTAERLQKGCNA